MEVGRVEVLVVVVRVKVVLYNYVNVTCPVLKMFCEIISA